MTASVISPRGSLRSIAAEIVAEGERKRIDDLIAWCRRGPRGAEVENVQIQQEAFRGDLLQFAIRR
jgi:acylphosphatase